MNQDAAVALIPALAAVKPAGDERRELEEAVRLILYEIWYTLGPRTAEEQLRPILEGTWAGDVLTRMKEHHQALMEARRHHEEENDPERVRQRREEKRRLRQEKHAERLIQQRARALIWHGKLRGGGE
ncbi:MAG: hypothetical protein ACREOS_11775 [Candidatus Dormibacteraceae bacterium]